MMKPVNDLSEQDFSRRAREAVAMSDAPAHLIRAAIDLWPAQPSPLFVAATAAREVLQRVVAALSFDSWAPAPMALGVRSMPSDTRQLLFSAEGRDIDLRISPAAENYALAGQILGPDETGTIELVAESDAAQTRSTSLDNLGEFRLEGITRGTYRMTLRMGQDEIVLPPIEVGPKGQKTEG